MPIINRASKFVAASTRLTTLSQTSVYVVPPNYSAVVRLLLVSNSDSASRNITIKWLHYDTATTNTIIGNHAISGNTFETYFTSDQPFYLHAGDVLYATAGTINVFDVTISVEEYYDPNRG